MEILSLPTVQLVFLYGPPAVGKLTVANEPAARRGFRVLHNHVTIDAVTTILPFGTEPFWETVGRIRHDLVIAAVREGVDLVEYLAFSAGDDPKDAELVQGWWRD